MKVTINGAVMRTLRVGDWSFLQADKVRELTSTDTQEGLLPGDILRLVVSDDPRAALSFGIVGYMLAGKDPSVLPAMSIESIVVDYRDESEGDGDSPPAAGGAPAKPKRRAATAPRVKKSRQKS